MRGVAHKLTIPSVSYYYVSSIINIYICIYVYIASAPITNIYIVYIVKYVFGICDGIADTGFATPLFVFESQRKRNRKEPSL